MSLLKSTVESHVAEVMQGLNESNGRAALYDQSKGNRCDALTLAVMTRMGTMDGITPRRELHRNGSDDWHYILAHEPLDAEPTDNDMMSDLNPWQWGGRGQGILHMKRGDLIEYLAGAGAPEHFVALRSVGTIVKLHGTRPNPFMR